MTKPSPRAILSTLLVLLAVGGAPAALSLLAGVSEAPLEIAQSTTAILEGRAA